MMTASGVLWSGFDYRLQGGFDTDCSFVAVRLNQLQGTVIGRASRGETTVQMPGMCIPGAGRRLSANTFH